jgi:hypothetical protein
VSVECEAISSCRSYVHNHLSCDTSGAIEPEMSFPWTRICSESKKKTLDKGYNYTTHRIHFLYPSLPRDSNSTKTSIGIVPPRLFFRRLNSVYSLFGLHTSIEFEVENQEHSCSFDSHREATVHSQPVVE